MPGFLFLAALFCAPIVHAAPTVLSAPIPFHDCRGLICIDARLDGGSPQALVLDTGNVNSWIVADMAQGLAWTLESVVRDGTPIPGVQRAGNHAIAIGDIGLAGKFLVFDRDRLGASAPPADGALAYPLFKDRIVQIDYPHHVLRISPTAEGHTSTAATAPGSLKVITFGKAGPPIVVGAPFGVNGKAVSAQIDTGFSGTLLVYDAAIDALGLGALKARGVPEFFPYTDGGVQMLALPGQRLSFAKTNLLRGSATIYFAGRGENTVHQPDGMFEATAGNALFAHSVLTFDFGAMTLEVHPAD